MGMLHQLSLTTPSPNLDQDRSNVDRAAFRDYSALMIGVEQQWNEYKRRRNLFLFALLGYMPVVATLGSLIVRVFHTETLFPIVLLAGWASLRSQRCASIAGPVPDAGNGSRQRGGIRIHLLAVAFTVDCRNTQTVANNCAHRWALSVIEIWTKPLSPRHCDHLRHSLPPSPRQETRRPNRYPEIQQVLDQSS
jgi:hypothetical protein